MFDYFFCCVMLNIINIGGVIKFVFVLEFDRSVYLDSFKIVISLHRLSDKLPNEITIIWIWFSIHKHIFFFVSWSLHLREFFITSRKSIRLFHFISISYNNWLISIIIIFFNHRRQFGLRPFTSKYSKNKFN